MAASANQLPVDVVRAMGADIVIAVDVGTPLAKMDSGASLLAFANQMTGFLTVKNTLASIAMLGPRDILIQPQFGDEVSTGDFSKVAESLAIGDTAAAQASPKLAVLSRPEADYRLQLAAQTKRNMTPPVIDFVRLDNKTAYSDELLLARLDAPLGQPLDVIRLEDSILHIYGLETLDKITYDVVEEDGRSGLVVQVQPHSYGPTYLETGLNLYSSFSSDLLINLRAGVLKSPFNSLGGEARLLAQVGSEPDVPGGTLPTAGRQGPLFRRREAQLLEREVDAVRRLRQSRSRPMRCRTSAADIYAGREFGNYGAVSVGWRRAYGQHRSGHRRPEPAGVGLPDRRGSLERDPGPARQRLSAARGQLLEPGQVCIRARAWVRTQFRPDQFRRFLCAPVRQVFRIRRPALSRNDQRRGARSRASSGSAA